ncbi:uncharacterized protein LOC127080593 [Lathyrus oleraceus]|uniref:uncharacterized protein LOC127080593 n=1 Tax=Pisum sativum TaxID=3888 RepID=UPI0021CF819A|nr:uncharacterized protein LOC127080593 [Pisum sativum]
MEEYDDDGDDDDDEEEEKEDEDGEDEEENNEENSQPMEHDHQVTEHGDWLGPTPGQHPFNNQVMDMLRNMQVQQQIFATPQEEKFTALQDQLQIQGDNFASFASIQEEQYADLRSQIQTHSDNNSFSSTILQRIDGFNRVLAGSVNTLNTKVIELTSLYEEDKVSRPPSGYRGRHGPFRGRRP